MHRLRRASQMVPTAFSSGAEAGLHAGSGGRAQPCSAESMSRFLDRLRENNRGASLKSTHVPLVLDRDVPYGFLTFLTRKYSFPSLLEYPDTFTMTQRELQGRSVPCLTLSPPLLRAGAVQSDRTAAVGAVMEALRTRGGVLSRWYGEMFPVVTAFGDEPAFLLERGAYTLLGVKGFGVHVNGFVCEGEDSPMLWVARRSASKATYPNMFDCIVGGGQPHGISLIDNVVKECQEEASIPEALARLARPVGAVSYTNEELAPNGARRVMRDTLFSFDLKLPVDFIPQPSDGEVQSFSLQSVASVLQLIEEGGPNGFKGNIHITMLDFLIRHGIIAADSPGYLAIAAKTACDE